MGLFRKLLSTGFSGRSESLSLELIENISLAALRET